MINLNATPIQSGFNGTEYPATLIEIEIEGGACEPQDLATLSIPDVPGDGGVVISGRAPVWLFSHLTHHFHVTKWVATFDPRLNGAVVTSTHARNVPPIGSVVTLPKSE